MSILCIWVGQLFINLHIYVSCWLYSNDLEYNVHPAMAVAKPDKCDLKWYSVVVFVCNRNTNYLTSVK